MWLGKLGLVVPFVNPRREIIGFAVVLQESLDF